MVRCVDVATTSKSPSGALLPFLFWVGKVPLLKYTNLFSGTLIPRKKEEEETVPTYSSLSTR